ncbi:MAG: hypothetical protein PHR44_04830 [Candidatus Omnitrophica bacterium]|nr:hypothetical protein [Candidatus Omnitrophota bacterium]
MKKRSLLVILVLAAAVFSPFTASAAEEKLEITTYYPSPYGVYKNLRVYEVDDITHALDEVGGNVPICCAQVRDVSTHNVTRSGGTCDNPIFPKANEYADRATDWLTCDRDYRAAFVTNQKKTWMINEGAIGGLAIGSLVNPTTFSNIVPWAGEAIGFMGVSDVVGLYGIGGHGVKGHGRGGYGVWATADDNSIAGIGVQTQGSTMGIHVVSQNADAIQAFPTGTGRGLRIYAMGTSGTEAVSVQHTGTGIGIALTAHNNLGIEAYSPSGYDFRSITSSVANVLLSSRNNFFYIEGPPAGYNWAGNALLVYNPGTGYVANFNGPGGVRVVGVPGVAALEVNPGNLSVAGEGQFGGGLRDNSNSLGTSGQVLTSTGSGVQWGSAGVQCVTQSSVGSNVTVACPSGYSVTGGGHSGLSPLNEVVASNPSGNGWHCTTAQANSSVTCYAVCCQ